MTAKAEALAAILMLFLAPIAALLLQLGISRQREYQADASGAKMVGHPYGLIRALEKLGAYNKRIPMDIPPSTSALLHRCAAHGRSDAVRPLQHAPAPRGAHRAASGHDGHPLAPVSAFAVLISQHFARTVVFLASTQKSLR